MRYQVGCIGPVLLFGAALVLVSGQSVPIEKSAKSVLEAKCLACHGAARISDLDLRERATILKGGKRGPAVVPGNAEESLLYKAVRREGELQMPLGKAPLTADEISALRDWINAGARLDATPATDPAPSWWSFRKPVRPALPAVKNAARVRNPIDTFILAKIEQNGLRPAPEADRPALARRAYFDLHGLPPTPSKSRSSSTTNLPTLMKSSSIACWRRPATVSVGDATGWTWCVTPIHPDSRPTTFSRRPGAIAIT